MSYILISQCSFSNFPFLLLADNQLLLKVNLIVLGFFERIESLFPISAESGFYFFLQVLIKMKRFIFILLNTTVTANFTLKQTSKGKSLEIICIGVIKKNDKIN